MWLIYLIVSASMILGAASVAIQLRDKKEEQEKEKERTCPDIE